MKQETLQRERLSSGAVAFADDGDTAVAVATRAKRVDVIHGVYAHSLPLAGMTIKQARVELEERMNIAPEAVAVIDGREATEDTILNENQVLNFITPAGEKG
jgi:hypothetical protein